ncbi:MAG: type VI secretion system ImpA family N-terminal domain-containing protein, partial [Planctomycetota bacterium]|nr:type VI secretion system ImpA family N-terminal domain-containing protein [Planctomycetota bacterium]
MAIDIEALCAPIDGDSPVGRDLIAAPLSDKEPMKSWAELDTELDEAVTNEAELMLPSDPAARRPKSPDWSQLADRLKTTLTKHSKDLRLSSRLTGVLTRTSGFEGLRDGLKLSRALCSRYWDSIHPQPTSEDDPDDADPRGLALVRDLSRIKLGTAIQQIPLVVGKSGAQYRFADYLMAAQGHNPNADSIDTIAAAGAKTDPQHFRKLLSDLDAALAELEQLDSELYERCGVSEKTGSRATSWTEWKETIKQYQSAVRIVGAHAFEQPAESDP